METKKKTKKNVTKKDVVREKESHLKENDPSEADETQLDLEKSVSDQEEAKQSTTTDGDKLKAAEDRYLRLQADFDNYRKRIVKERQIEIKRANKDLFLGLLPVVDNFERALAACENVESAFGKGIDMVYKQFQEELKKNGVEEIEADSKPFDPKFHQAVAKETQTDTEPDMVIAVFQKGYTLHNEVLRPAVVKVSE